MGRVGCVLGVSLGEGYFRLSYLSLECLLRVGSCFVDFGEALVLWMEELRFREVVGFVLRLLVSGRC